MRYTARLSNWYIGNPHTLIDSLLNIFRGRSKTEAPQAKLVTIPRDAHSISRKQINPNAIKVLYRLKNSGYQGLLVGGCVRDLMLGIEPKDFDVATNATPEQVRQLFSNSRLIGRRFKLVHVNFGRDTIEVATFRAAHDPDTSHHTIAKANDHGMLVRDNVYGTLDDDAARRDFTVNAIYYDIADFSIKALPQGLKDIDDRVLRIMGDPEQRYREDPVRMIRAARFAAKLHFTIDEKTSAPFQSLASLLTNVSSARMFDETLKLLLGGYAHETFETLDRLHLLKPLLPATARAIQSEHPFNRQFILQALNNTDDRIRAGKSITPAFLFAALLWPDFLEKRTALINQGMPEAPATQKAAQIAIMDQVKYTAIPKRFTLPIKEIWDLQWRLTKRTPQKALALLEQSRFRAGYDFMLLREQAGEPLDGLGDWWTKFQAVDEEGRTKMLNIKSNKPKRSRAPKKRPAASSD